MAQHLDDQDIISLIKQLSFFSPSVPTVGLIVPTPSNPFFAHMGFVLSEKLKSQDFNLVISASDGKVEREAQILDRYLRANLAAIVLVSADPLGDALLSLSQNTSTPIILLDRERGDKQLSEFTVQIDDAFDRLFQHLNKVGLKKPVYISGPRGIVSSEKRISSYLSRVRLLGIADETPIHSGEFTEQHGYHTIKALNKTGELKNYDCVVCGNDSIAIGVLSYFHNNNIRVPDEYSVVGFDDIPIAQWCCPALTTIHQPLNELAHEITQHIIQLHDPDFSDNITTVEKAASLIIRSTTPAENL